MPLSAEAQLLLRQMARIGMPAVHTLAPADVRRQFQGLIKTGPRAGTIANAENRVLPGPGGEIPVRVYRPAGDGPWPALIYMHGGGWVLGDLDMCDGTCRSLANLAGCLVISVQYRLAPEHKFPAALEDAYAALQWVSANRAGLNVDPGRLAVGGDSAGGNLAGAVALMARDLGGPPLVFQLLVYPVTNCQVKPDRYPVGEATDYFLSLESMDWFNAHYLQAGDETNPYVSLLLAGSLAGLPRALVITAEYDLLAAEGQAYAQRLEQSGVPVRWVHFEGMVHGFFTLNLDISKQAVQLAADELRAAFNTELTRPKSPASIDRKYLADAFAEPQT